MGDSKAEDHCPPPLWTFIHDTANVFFYKHLLYENILTLTNQLTSLLRWMTLSGRDDWGKWRPVYKVFSHENGLKFSKKVAIFSKTDLLQTKVFTFYEVLLLQCFLEVSPTCMPNAPTDPPLCHIIWL